MTTRELYISIGVSGYEHEGCWGKDGIFHIRMEAPRLACRRCKQVLNAVLPNVVPRCTDTQACARHVGDLRKMMSIRDVSVSDTMIRSIDKKSLQQKFGNPRLRDLEIIAIDEIYVGKKHKFFTIVIDWTTGAIVFVGEGKGENALKPLWKRHRGSKASTTGIGAVKRMAYGSRDHDYLIARRYARHFAKFALIE